MTQLKVMSKTFQVDSKGWAVQSSEPRRITFIGAVPGTLGYGSDGTVFEYGPGSHFLHVLDKQPIVDLNHHQDEVIGTIVETSTTQDGRLKVTIELHEKYSYLESAILEDKYDGVSIESVPLSGQWLDDFYFRIDSYVLTGIAVLIAKPPSCEKGLCNVISHAPSKFISMLTQVENNTEDQNIDLLLSVVSSLSTAPTTKGNNMCKYNTDETTSNTTRAHDNTDFSDHDHNALFNYGSTLIGGSIFPGTNTGNTFTFSKGCTCKDNKDDVFNGLTKSQLEKMQKIIAEKLAPQNTDTSESDSNPGDNMTDNTDVTVETEIEVIADAPEADAVEAVVEETAAEVTEEPVEAPAEEEIVEVVSEAAPEEAEGEVEAETDVELETVASEAAPEPVEAETVIDMDLYVEKEAHDATVAERDSLLVAHSALMNQLARLAPEDSLDKATLKAASEFIPGYDSEKALYEQSGEIVAKVLSFNAVTSSAKVESTSAGAEETVRTPAKDNKGTAPAIKFNGLTAAAEWAKARKDN